MTRDGERCSLLLVDGTALLYRSFYGVRDLCTAAGRPTNAVFGFIKSFRELVQRMVPARCAVVLDGGLPAFRRELLPEYKAQRPPMPDALRAQIEPVIEFLSASGCRVVRLPVQEADDVMATLAVATDAGLRVRVATSDKDMMQLVDERVNLVTLPGGREQVGPAEVVAKTGVRPDQVPDWLALTGDSSDNIPGVEGVGAKTAAALLQQFGTIDAILARATAIRSERIRERVLSARDVLLRNRRLVTLDRTVPGVPAVGELALAQADAARLAALYRELEFHSLLKEQGAAPVAGPAQGELF